VPYTDAIDPVVALDQPDGAAYVEDQVPVAPHWTCTDRGGSTLSGCTADGLVDGHLSTVPGPHTVSVTATDGAGNTTVVTRHYTVLSAHQPDGLIRKAGTARWKGDNVYGPATDQTVLQHARRRHLVRSFWRVQNDGARSDAFSLIGTAGTARYRVRYFASGVDVTAAVVGGAYRTALLEPGQSATLRVEVTPKRRARIGSHRTVTLTATSAASGTAHDRVATKVTVRR
jgi:hypothetical protein